MLIEQISSNLPTVQPLSVSWTWLKYICSTVRHCSKKCLNNKFNLSILLFPNSKNGALTKSFDRYRSEIHAYSISYAQLKESSISHQETQLHKQITIGFHQRGSDFEILGLFGTHRWPNKIVWENKWTCGYVSEIKEKGDRKSQWHGCKAWIFGLIFYFMIAINLPFNLEF